MVLVPLVPLVCFLHLAASIGPLLAASSSFQTLIMKDQATLRD